MSFTPLTVAAQYPGISRGLTADVLATQAVSGTAHTICTSHVVAGRGVVTDVLNVPTDNVAAQLEHVFETESPTAAKVGIIGDAPTVEAVFDHLGNLEGPIILDLTLSGPSGEDVVGQQGLEALIDHINVPDLVAVRRRDAALVAGMEIPSLDDAQVAAQRLVQQGAQRVLLRCGRLPTHHYETDSEPPDYALDLYCDGSDFALFEAPYLDQVEGLHGASSAFLIPLLHHLQNHDAFERAIQKAKARVSEALRAANNTTVDQVSVFFRRLETEPTITEA